MDESKLLSVIADLLCYSMADVNWTFGALTEEEQDIVGDQETLDAVRAWADAQEATDD